MTLYLDNANNYLMGDLSFNSSTLELTSNVDASSIYTNFLNLAIKSGIKVELMPTESQVQSLFTTAVGESRFLGVIGLKDEPYSGTQRLRLIFGPATFGFYNDSGVAMPLFGSIPSSTNRVFTVGNRHSAIGRDTLGLYCYILNADPSVFEFAGVSSGNSFAFFHSQFDSVPPTSIPIRKNNIQFYYLGALQNYNSSYLGNSIMNRQLCLHSGTTAAYTPTSTGLYSTTPDGSAEHYIVWGKIQTPGGTEKIETNLSSIPYYQAFGSGQWATDYIVYGESGNILGKAPNLKVANGYVFPHRPIKLQSYSESGYNCWLPVGKIGPYTLLMRCYSSTLGSGAITSVSLDTTDQVLYPRFCNVDTSLWN